MRRLTVFCCAALLAACAKKDNAPAADTTAMTMTPAATTASMAGKWSVRVMKEGSDSTLLTYEMNATADASGWTLTFPGRDPMPLRVTSMTADSVVTDAGPYESALRNKVQVWTHTVAHMEGDKMMSTTVAHYAVTTQDSVVNLHGEGVRIP